MLYKWNDIFLLKFEFYFLSECYIFLTVVPNISVKRKSIAVLLSKPFRFVIWQSQLILSLKWKKTSKYLGQVSLPCNIRAPIVNHSELCNVNLFTLPLSSRSFFLFHSAGLNLLTTNIPRLTTIYPTTIQIQSGSEKGFIKENTPGFCISGVFIMMLIPLFMNGFEKATTSSLSFVIVNGATASSASYEKVKEMIEACRNGKKILCQKHFVRK